MAWVAQPVSGIDHLVLQVVLRLLLLDSGSVFYAL